MEQKYSVIIPYQHSEERKPLLFACIDTLFKLSGGSLEICVHEVGSRPHLTLPSRCKYLFTEFSGIFHRAWAINRGVKKLATGDILVLMDGDLIINSEWMNELFSTSDPKVGWGKLNWLNQSGTKTFLKTGHLDNSYIDKTKYPKIGSAAGAITVIPSQLFHSLNGIPEDFYGSWGGEDNAFWFKLSSFGYKFKSFKSSITHLYHSNSTPRVKEVQRKALQMFYWNNLQWQEHIKNSPNWGSTIPSLPEPEDYNSISTKSKAPLTLAMLSWIRPDKLIQTLTTLHETLTIPINLTLMVQGCETLNSQQKKVIKELSSRFYRSDVFYTKGNIGTGPARKSLVERSLNRFQSPYINLADDDTYYTKGSVEAAIELMNKDLSIGVVGIRYKPKIYVLNSIINPCSISMKPVTSSMEYVDSTGSASAIIRREVFDLCKIDSDYKLGQWDLDLFLQARSVGWKIVNYQSFNGMKAINNWGGSKEYRVGRMNRTEINKSIKLFKQKWGLVNIR